MIRWFSETVVREALPMRDAIDAVERIFRELGRREAGNRPRQRVRAGGRMLHTMSASSTGLGLLGLKSYSTGREGARFLLVLFEAASGEPVAVMEADALGQVRTGAATGVAARHLAPAGASTLGIVGCGYQARSQLLALAEVRPLREVHAFCRNPETRRAFAREMGKRTGIPVLPAPSAESAVRGKELVVAITSAREPVVRGAWIRPGAFVAAAGGNSLGRRELDAEAVQAAARIVVDDREQARIECGDLDQVVRTGALAWDRVETLGEVVAAGKPPASGGALFESQGIAAEDIAVAAVVLERAAGVAIPFSGEADKIAT